MIALIAGLVLFLGVHSARLFADRWRGDVIARRGPNAWKGPYTLVSLAGFALIVWGYGLARQQPVALWQPPTAMKHAASLLTLLAFILITAAYVPGNALKARLHHPMTLGVKAWALGHLLANHTLADLLLFGGFLAWSIAVFVAARRRDRAAGVRYAPGRLGPTLVTLGLGALLWAAFALWAHAWLIGVRPFG